MNTHTHTSAALCCSFPGDHMRRMDDMFANPMFASPFMAVGPAAVDGRQQVPNAGRQVAPRMPAGPVDMFGGMFGQMNNMMGNMPGMMQGMMVRQLLHGSIGMSTLII